MTQYIILDRDGVINQDSINYIKSVDEFHFVPGAVDAIAQLTQAGFVIGVATNQSGVSRGFYSEAVLNAIHHKLIQGVEAAGGKIAAIEYCIHLPSEHCACRKPQPGMLLALAEKMHCSLTGIPFVGDRVSDIEAALSVKAEPILIVSPMTDKEALHSYSSVPIYHSLAEYVHELLS